MRGRPVLHRIELGAWEPSMLREVLLALFFLAGALAGHVYALCCDEGAQAELGRYLRDFCAVYDAGGTASSLWSCAVLYFGGGVLVFLLGFSCAGVALIPALAALIGFLSMYTVSCFVRCFGRAGVVLAMGLMGIRLLFTLPCFSLWRTRRGRCPRSCSRCPLVAGSVPPRCSMGANMFSCLCFVS